MRPRGPSFAWWVIPATMGLGIATSMGIAEFGGGRYIEPNDVAIPAGFTRDKESRWRNPDADHIDHHTLDRDFETIAVWSDQEGKRDGHYELGRFIESKPVDDAFAPDLERTLRSRAGAKFTTNRVALERHQGRAVAIVDVTDGDRRLRVGTTQVGDDAVLMLTISSSRDDEGYAEGFASTLDSLASMSPHRRRPSAAELRRAAVPGLLIGAVACFPLAFGLSLWRRRQWERVQLERVAPAALAAGPPPRARPSWFAWPFFAGGLVIGCVVGATIGAARHPDRLIEARDIVAPPSYVPENIPFMHIGKPPPGAGNSVVLATWIKPSVPGLLWVSRMKEDVGTPMFGTHIFLKAFERGLRETADKHHIPITIKTCEMRERAGRPYAYVDYVMGNWEQHAIVMRIGRSEVLLNAMAPASLPEVQREGLEAMIDDLTRLPPPRAPRAERYGAAGKGAGFGFAGALLPSIGLGAVFRRRR